MPKRDTYTVKIEGVTRRLGPDLEQIRTSRKHLLFTHPDDGRFELVGDACRRIGAAEQVAATDVDLVAKRDRYRLPGNGTIQIAVLGDNARDDALLAGGQNAQTFPQAHCATHDAS